MIERRRLKQLDTFCTGVLTWEVYPAYAPAYDKFSVMAAARCPDNGPAYLLRFVGEKVGERMIYLSRTLHDQSSYIGCRLEPRLMELCRIAEKHATLESLPEPERMVMPSGRDTASLRPNQTRDETPPPITRRELRTTSRRTVGAVTPKRGPLF